MTREEFEEKIGAIVRVHGTDVTVDLSDELVAYWNGNAIAYVLTVQTSSAHYEHFDMDDGQWQRSRPWLEAWIDAPTFSVRPETRHWLSPDPPADACT